MACRTASCMAAFGASAISTFVRRADTPWGSHTARDSGWADAPITIDQNYYASEAHLPKRPLGSPFILGLIELFTLKIVVRNSAQLLMEMANVVDENTWWSALDAMGEDFSVSTIVRGIHASCYDNGCGVIPSSSDCGLGNRFCSFVGFACTGDTA